MEHGSSAVTDQCVPQEHSCVTDTDLAIWPFLDANLSTRSAFEHLTCELIVRTRNSTLKTLTFSQETRKPQELGQLGGVEP